MAGKREDCKTGAAILTFSGFTCICGFAKVMVQTIEFQKPSRCNGWVSLRIGGWALKDSAFGEQAATRPPSVCYLERATSTTLRIKVAKANNAPKKMHNSAKVICTPFEVRDDGIVAAKQAYEYFCCEYQTGLKSHRVTGSITSPTRCRARPRVSCRRHDSPHRRGDFRP